MPTALHQLGVGEQDAGAAAGNTLLRRMQDVRPASPTVSVCLSPGWMPLIADPAMEYIG